MKGYFQLIQLLLLVKIDNGVQIRNMLFVEVCSMLLEYCIISPSIIMHAMFLVCDPPESPANGMIVEGGNNVTLGAEITFGCNDGYSPGEKMTAVCEESGWRLNPAQLICSQSGSYLYSIANYVHKKFSMMSDFAEGYNILLPRELC